MTGLELGLLAGSIGSAVFNTGSSIWNAWKTRSREDNAVQRRAEDLRKAGLNPNLAAGSAAAAGLVSAPKAELNLGQMIDAATASQQIQQQRYATEAAKSYADMMKHQEASASFQAILDKANLFYQLGVPVDGIDVKVGGKDNFDFSIFTDQNDIAHADWKSSPFFNMLQNGLSFSGDQAAMAGKANAWFNANQVFNQVWNGVDALTDVGKTVGGLVDIFKPKSTITNKSGQSGKKTWNETTTTTQRR